jgi:protein-S-isoprenylcysteine O-methyltransferase Ste14
MADDDDRHVKHPNREKAASKLTRAVVVLLLLLTAAVVAIISLGGWSATEGAKPLQVVFILLYLLFTYYVLRWKRGVLPMIAGLAVLLGIFGAVAAPGWFDRDKAGFTSPALPEDVLGLLCALLVPLQAALIVFAMQGFRQAWNVEVERPRESRGDPEPAAA